MSIGPLQLLIILAIVLVIFGFKKLRNLGGDLGGAIRDFKKAVKEEGENASSESGNDDAKKIGNKSDRVIDAEVTSKKKNKS